jgi:hypothetical protein
MHAARTGATAIHQPTSTSDTSAASEPSQYAESGATETSSAPRTGSTIRIVVSHSFI